MYNTQQKKVLALLQNAGNAGVNSYDLTYTHRIKQAPTRISELKEQGYIIKSQQNKNRSVTYILIKSTASNRTTVTSSQPQYPKDEELVRVEKNGRVFWEKPEDLKQKGLGI